MLRLYHTRNGREDLRREVVKALEAANTKIAGLETRILELRRLMQGTSRLIYASIVVDGALALQLLR